MTLKRNVFIFLLTVVFVALLIPSFSYAFYVTVSNTYPKGGDTVVIKVGDTKTPPSYLLWGSERIYFYEFHGKYVAFLGLKVTEPVGWKKLTIYFNDGTKKIRWLKVGSRKIVTQNLKLSQFVGKKAQEIAKEMVEENKLLNQIALATSTIYFSEAFGMPLLDNKKITTGYGVLRKDGTQDTWHLGIDLDAPKGAPVFAINNGMVEFASSTLSYGNTVIINHGGGIFSLYLHLNKILVAKGNYVKKGDLIGEVGDTGYVTGPHLHLSIKVNGVSVDPLSFLNVLQNNL